MVKLFGEEYVEKVHLYFESSAPLKATVPCPTPVVLSSEGGQKKSSWSRHPGKPDL